MGDRGVGEGAKRGSCRARCPLMTGPLLWNLGKSLLTLGPDLLASVMDAPGQIGKHSLR